MQLQRVGRGENGRASVTDVAVPALDVLGHQERHLQLGQQRLREPKVQPLVLVDDFGCGEHQRVVGEQDAFDVLGPTLEGHFHGHGPMSVGWTGQLTICVQIHLKNLNLNEFVVRHQMNEIRLVLALTARCLRVNQ